MQPKSVYVNYAILGDGALAERSRLGGGGGGGGMPQTGMPFTNGFSFDGDISEGQMKLTIDALDVLLAGNWTIMWGPPVSAQSITSVPTTTQSLSACLTKEPWQKALQKKESLPPDIKIALTLAQMWQADETFDLIVSLDGRSLREKGDFGYTSASFSPDGTRIVHSITNGDDPSNGLDITDLASGTVTPLPGTAIGDGNPLWSPDGNRITFTRGMDSGILGNPSPHNIVIVNVDGSNLSQITSGNDANRAMTWMPDSIHLIYTVGHLSRASINMNYVVTGETNPLFETNFPYSSVKVSPDGTRLVFEDMLTGEKYAVFVYSLNDTDRRLLVNDDPVIATSPFWSPNGRWVIVSVATELPSNSPEPILALIQIDSCKIIPLTSLGGYVSSWLP